MKLLEIQSSARQAGSLSRILSNEFIQEKKTTSPTIEHKQRDVGMQAPEPPNALWTEANLIHLF